MTKYNLEKIEEACKIHGVAYCKLKDGRIVLDDTYDTSILYNVYSKTYWRFPVRDPYWQKNSIEYHGGTSLDNVSAIFRYDAGGNI